MGRGIGRMSSNLEIGRHPFRRPFCPPPSILPSTFSFSCYDLDKAAASGFLFLLCFKATFLFLAHCAHAHAPSSAGKCELSATLFVNGLWWCAILVPSDLFAVPEIYLMQMTVSAPKRLSFLFICWKRNWQACFLCSFPGK